MGLSAVISYVKGAARGATTDAEVTATVIDGNHVGLDVNVVSASVGGGGPATIADGADVAQGTTTDLASASTVIGLLKNLKAALAGALTVTGPATDVQLRASPLSVSGTVSANATLAVETTKVIGTVNQGTSPWVVGAHAVTNAGTFAVQQSKPATGTTSSPPSVTTVVATVLAANAARYGATVYNESGAICYLKLGATATLTDYTLQVAIGGYYEVPFSYTGIITGITSAGTAVLRVTEITT